MGALVAHEMVPSIQNEVNLRFAPGDPILEMKALHREFGLFSGKHELASVASVLNIRPRHEKEQEGWIAFLRYLKKLKSDVPGTNAHKRIIMAVRDELEAEKSRPIFFTWHPASVNNSLMVTAEPAFSFSSTKYLVISVPIGNAKGGAPAKAK
jgi:hypothetical protein